jgi:hypothetical protein
MMAIKPWYKVVTPREDLREARPLDAAEFAVHLNHVRDGRADEDYQDPARFFARTFLTKHLTGLASEVIRRLSGETTETSAVFNMATQFGGGKTHALTLHYHSERELPLQTKPGHGRDPPTMGVYISHAIFPIFLFLIFSSSVNTSLYARRRLLAADDLGSGPLLSLEGQLKCELLYIRRESPPSGYEADGCIRPPS